MFWHSAQVSFSNFVDFVIFYFLIRMDSEHIRIYTQDIVSSRGRRPQKSAQKKDAAFAASERGGLASSVPDDAVLLQQADPLPADA